MKDIFIKDDICQFKIKFDKYIKNNNIYFDKYSLLSVLYLFNCNKILSKYEKILIKNFNKEVLDFGYINCIDREFCKIAKLNVELFLDKKTISPIEVLLLKNDNRKIIKLQRKLKNDDINIIDQLLKKTCNKKLLLIDNEIKKVPLTKKQYILRFSLIAFFISFIFFGGLFIKQQSNLIYKYNSKYDGYEVKCGMLYNPTEISIPDTYKNKKVIGITSKSFSNKKKLKQVNIGNNIVFIEENAFYNCPSLKNINVFSNSNIDLNILTNCSNYEVDIDIYYKIELYDEEQLIDIFNVKYGEKYKVIVLEKLGYNFLYWTDKNELPLTDETGVSLNIYELYADSIFYAMWSVNINSVIFDGNGSTSGEMSSINGKTDEVITIPANEYERLGYTFIGWSNTPNGEVLYNDEDTYLITYEPVITLYAVWEANINRIIFDGNGSTSGEMSSINGKTDELITLLPNKFERLGYTFIGWSNIPNGEVLYNDEDSYLIIYEPVITLYAVWDANVNTIIFDGNGSTSGEMSSINGKTDESIIIPANEYERLGYDFIGWSNTPNGEVLYNDEDSYLVTYESVKTLYAVWEANVNTIIFDGNGSTSGEMSLINGKTDDLIILPENQFIKEGYYFIGWSNIPNGEVLYNDEDLYLITYEPVITLYAVWDANVNTIIFDGNGSTSGEMSLINGKTDDLIILPENQFIKEGYYFIGWSNIPNGEVLYNDEDSYLIIYEPVITLYAVWDANVNTIIFDGNGSTSGEMSSINGKTDESIIIPANEYERLGYDFIGWSNTPNGEVLYNDEDSYLVTYESVKTLYAVWEANVNTIIFDGNGSTSGEMSLINGKTDDLIILPENQFIKEGYYFIGWSNIPNGEVLYNDEDLYLITYEPVITLYTVWDANVNTIIFDGNGSTSGEMSSINGKTDESIIIPANEYERLGYDFIGWSNTPNGEVLYNDEDSYLVTYESVKTLYAVWEANVNTIIFDGNGSTSGEMSLINGKTDDLIILPENQFIKEGYYFIGWSNIPNGEVLYNDEDLYLITYEPVITLYTVWDANVNTIIFDGNGSTSGEMSSINGKTDGSIVLPENQFIKEGYYFMGWSDIPYGDVLYKDNSFYLVTSEPSITLYAVWSDKFIYYINNNYDLVSLIELNDYNKYDEIVLTTDLDFQNSEFIPFNNFTSVFKGNYHTISNLKIVNAGGFFVNTQNAIIENLGLINISVSSNGGSAGGLIGTASNTIIRECFTSGIVESDRFDGSSTDTRSYVGGLVGSCSSDLEIINSYSNCDVIAKGNYLANAGGLLGKYVPFSPSTLTITNCYATGKIETYAKSLRTDSRSESGGLIGNVNIYTSGFGSIVNITNCYATGDTYSSGNYITTSDQISAAISNVTFNKLNIYYLDSQKCYESNILISNASRYASIINLSNLYTLLPEIYDESVWILTQDSNPILKGFS